MNIRYILGIFLVLVIGGQFISPVVVDSDFVTFYPGEENRIEINVENNGNFDIEDVSLRLDLEKVPFIAVGSSERDIDDLDSDDDDSVSFALLPSSDITPGDYNIPYVLTYFNLDTDDDERKEGTFGIRVSAKTELDFSVETENDPIIGNQGTVSFEIINRGLGELKAISVQIFPEGYTLLSKDKIFVGTLDADDTDVVTFDVVYQTPTPTLKVKVDYKDFDNEDHSQLVQLPFKVYTKEEAKQLGLVSQGNSLVYILILVVLLILWFVYRKIRKNNKKKKQKKE